VLCVSERCIESMTNLTIHCKISQMTDLTVHYKINQMTDLTVHCKINQMTDLTCLSIHLILYEYFTCCIFHTTRPPLITAIFSFPKFRILLLTTFINSANSHVVCSNDVIQRYHFPLISLLRCSSIPSMDLTIHRSLLCWWS